MNKLFKLLEEEAILHYILYPEKTACFWNMNYMKSYIKLFPHENDFIKISLEHPCKVIIQLKPPAILKAKILSSITPNNQIEAKEFELIDLIHEELKNDQKN